MKWHPIDSTWTSKPGVYAIILDGVTAYVGTSIQVGARVKAHALPTATACGLYRGVAFTDCKVKVRAEACNMKRLCLESALIRRLLPACNLRDTGRQRGKIVIRTKGSTMHNQEFRRFVKKIGSQAKVAKMLDLSTGYVSLLFHGKRRVSVDLAERIEIATSGEIRKELLVFRPKRTGAAQGQTDPSA